MIYGQKGMTLMLPLNSFWLSESWTNTKSWSETSSTAGVAEDMAEGFVIPLVWRLLHQGTPETWRWAELWGYVWDISVHEIVDRSQFGSPLFLFLITHSQFKRPQIQFSSQQVISVILQYTRVGRNCPKICFEVAMETISLLSSWFSVALQFSFSYQMSIQETSQCQEKNAREKRKGLSTTSI